MTEDFEDFIRVDVHFENSAELEGVETDPFHLYGGGQIGTQIEGEEVALLILHGIGQRVAVCPLEDGDDFAATATSAGEKTLGHDDVPPLGLPEEVRFDQQIPLLFERGFDEAFAVFP